MNIPELKEAVNKSDMDTEAKVEIIEIIEDMAELLGSW